jgi:hypothetical protein
MKKLRLPDNDEVSDAKQKIKRTNAGKLTLQWLIWG